MEYQDILKQVKKAKEDSKKIDLKKWEAIFPPLDKLSQEEIQRRLEELLEVRARIEEEKLRRKALEVQTATAAGGSTSESKK